MKRCTYCGKEYGAETSICAIDGQPVQEVVSSSPVSKSFFRWKPLSISLIALAVLYWGVALLNLWLVRMLEQQGDTRKLRFLLWGAFWNVVVGALCLGGRRLIKSGSRLSYGAGALAVGASLLIVMRTWLSGLLTARNPFPVVEALLIWPWLIYAFIYASSAILKQVRAEQSGST